MKSFTSHFYESNYQQFYLNQKGKECNQIPKRQERSADPVREKIEKSVHQTLISLGYADFKLSNVSDDDEHVSIMNELMTRFPGQVYKSTDSYTTSWGHEDWNYLKCTDPRNCVSPINHYELRVSKNEDLF